MDEDRIYADYMEVKARLQVVEQENAALRKSVDDSLVIFRGLRDGRNLITEVGFARIVEELESRRRGMSKPRQLKTKDIFAGFSDDDLYVCIGINHPIHNTLMYLAIEEAVELSGWLNKATNYLNACSVKKRKKRK